MTEPADIIDNALRDQALDFLRLDPRTFVVQLPGERRLKTTCWLTIGEHAVTIEAFVVRKPEENADQVHELLLKRNARTYVVSWSIDESDDIYLTGRLPLAAVNAKEIDRVLGSVLESADGTFNTLLQLGFGSSIRREWAWRIKNGESLANLAAFAEFAQRRD
jgi:hypothetical protein